MSIASFILQGPPDLRWNEVSQYIAKHKPIFCSQNYQMCRHRGNQVTFAQSLRSVLIDQENLEELEKEVQQLEDRERDVIGDFDNETDTIQAEYKRELLRYDEICAPSEPRFQDPGEDVEQTPKVRKGLRRWRAWTTKAEDWEARVWARRYEKLANLGTMGRRIDELHHSINDIQLAVDRSERLVDQSIALFQG
ncbi:uncharacterized protein PAC_18113 [Phialocephala subalpina]|uniref:Uncharacterized protein n=1 Tax=Phialocephala subalpina TaxID=576137 RepID=A0A1L7XT38_9HELO|nr:uncharacterized protein PAC_18113 [Phialocephala subalpina]